MRAVPLFAIALTSLAASSAQAHGYGRWLCPDCGIGYSGSKENVASLIEAIAFIKANNLDIIKSGPTWDKTPRWVPRDTIVVCDGDYCLPLMYFANGNWLPMGDTYPDVPALGYKNKKSETSLYDQYDEPGYRYRPRGYFARVEFMPILELRTFRPRVDVGPLIPIYDFDFGSFSGGADSGWGCVEVESFLPDGRRAGEIRVGDTMQLGDPKSFKKSMGVVTVSERRSVLGFRIVTASGVALRCSNTAPIPTPKGLVLAPDLMGLEVAVRRDEGGGNACGWERVVMVVPLGLIEVQHITVGDQCFWAGEAAGKYLLHHNLKLVW